jgi:hypothetical protein
VATKKSLSDDSKFSQESHIIQWSNPKSYPNSFFSPKHESQDTTIYLFATNSAEFNLISHRYEEWLCFNNSKE